MPATSNVLAMIDEKSMMHGYDWAGEVVNGWWASEKFRGCRAYWDGLSLWTRGGHRVHAPAAFVAQLPSGMPLDGEVWVGYGAEDESRASIAVRLGHWLPGISFKVFDAPSLRGTWSHRMSIADEAVRGRANVHTVTRAHIISFAHLSDMFRHVAARNGEGLVLRDSSQASYTPGRTRRILKFKQPQHEQLMNEFPHLRPAA